MLGSRFGTRPGKRECQLHTQILASCGDRSSFTHFLQGLDILAATQESVYERDGGINLVVPFMPSLKLVVSFAGGCLCRVGMALFDGQFGDRHASVDDCVLLPYLVAEGQSLLVILVRLLEIRCFQI